jgi:hypothetical protein
VILLGQNREYVSFWSIIQSVDSTRTKHGVWIWSRMETENSTGAEWRAWIPCSGAEWRVWVTPSAADKGKGFYYEADNTGWGGRAG